MADSRNYIILLGTNTGDRLMALKTAEERIQREIGPVVVSSAIYETAPWGKTDQHSFLNKVISGYTKLDPVHVVRASLAIEESMGRKRRVKWEPRTIDIDLLFLDDQVVTADEVTIPHPMLHLRRFTLVPLFDIFPDFRHPVLDKTIAQLLAEVEDTLPVKPFNAIL
jgi:2-amino-4-hydroxy-6-hydroxymethyldihydropteridine diphosphokinase